MKRVLVALLLVVAGCRGEQTSESGQPPSSPSTPPVAAPEQPVPQATQVSLRLAARQPLPQFPITLPSFDDHFPNAGRVVVDANGSFSPSVISRLALERYNRWRSNKPSPIGEDYIRTAVTQTDWLAANIDCKNGFGVWHYPFPSFFDAQPGWVSGFGNAHAIVALLIMSRFIPDPERYINPALCAIKAFDVDVADGGVKTLVEGGGKWYEEYALPSRPGVINGHVFALAGLHYACEEGGIQEACSLFQDGLTGLRPRLPKYDAGFTSYYSLFVNNFTNPSYNELNAGVLDWLHSVTGDAEVKRFATLFRDYNAETFKVQASSTGDPANHGPDRLTDGFIFFEYWSSFSFPTTLDFDQGSRRPIRALALAFVGDEPATFQYAIVGDDGAVGEYKDAPAPQKLTRYTTDNFRTTVAVFAIGIDAQRLRLRFNTPLPGTEVIALREINVLH